MLFMVWVTILPQLTTSKYMNLEQFVSNLHEVLPEVHTINIVRYHSNQNGNINSNEIFALTKLFKNNTMLYTQISMIKNMSAANLISSRHHTDGFIFVYDILQNKEPTISTLSSNICGLLTSVNKKDYIIIQAPNLNQTLSLLSVCPLTYGKNVMAFYNIRKHHYQTDIILKEFYKMTRTSQEILHRNIVRYSYGANGEELLQKQIPTSVGGRATASGLIFHAVTAVWPPFVTKIIKYSNKYNQTRYKPEGLYIDIINIVINRLNATIQYHGVSQKWSEMVQSVSSGRYDLGATGFSQNSKRYELVDFSFGLMTTSLRIVYPRFSKTDEWKTHFHPFRTESWLYICGYAAVTSILLWVANALIVIIGSNSNHGLCFEIEMIHNFFQSAAFSMLSLIGKRYPIEPKKLGIRIAFFGISFCGFILIR